MKSGCFFRMRTFSVGGRDQQLARGALKEIRQYHDNRFWLSKKQSAHLVEQQAVFK